MSRPAHSELVSETVALPTLILTAPLACHTSSPKTAITLPTASMVPKSLSGPTFTFISSLPRGIAGSERDHTLEHAAHRAVPACPVDDR
jgi:hypothetical protein